MVHRLTPPACPACVSAVLNSFYGVMGEQRRMNEKMEQCSRVKFERLMMISVTLGGCTYMDLNSK